ncbi:unnamed protein product, partial [Rotaria sp. Silwood2]
VERRRLRERRSQTDSNATTSNTNIHREKVTFKQLQCQGVILNIHLKHESSSNNWYSRFMTYHRFSLQRQKRQQKVLLTNTYKHVTSFYSYIHRASKRASKQGPMDAFTPLDICNMDESPLELFSDQSKRSINDIGSSIDIEGNLINK